MSVDNNFNHLLCVQILKAVETHGWSGFQRIA
jgi:hypothetical protein